MRGKCQGFENLQIFKTNLSKNFSVQNVIYGKKIKRAFTFLMAT